MAELSYAIASAMVHGPEAGLELLKELEKDERIAGSHRLDAVRAHLLERAGHCDARREGGRSGDGRRTLLSVRLEDAVESEEIFSTLMGEDVESRRKFIEENALDVKNLDV